MNPEQLLNLAEIAMLACTDHSAYRYVIHFSRGKIYCEPALTAPKGCVVVYFLTRYQLENGLLTTEWNILSDKLAKIWKELNL